MSRQDTKKNQALLENWFKKPKAVGADANKVDAAATDDDGEGRTLPPPSEPDSDIGQDSAEERAAKKGKGKRSIKVVDSDDDMAESDDNSAKKTKVTGKKKLLVASEVDKPAAKPRKPRASAATKAKAVTKKTATKAKSKPKGKKGDSDEEPEEDEDVGSDDGTDGRYKLKTHPDDLKLPPLSTMPSIFKDIVDRNPKLRDVAELFKQHNSLNASSRKLRVGTMCSGTESPLLALKLISEAMELDGGSKLEIEHIFSCEIEPFKQAYIERNFRPPVLFRDVTELQRDEATTAYGAAVPVPGNIDLLIAGTSCVDYSTLNAYQKSIDAGGESGNTFYGMLCYVKKHRPPVVILENVCGAPWDHVCKEFEGIDYRAKQIRLDTKQFYIPHTRTRGYLVAIEAQRTKEGVDVDIQDLVEKWADGMKSYMQRPASCTLDAFMLPSDDPRIHEGRQRLALETKTSALRRRKEVDWARCEQRHTRCRADEKLGNKRPLTKWDEGGGFQFMDHIWEDWCADAVSRVKDLMDVSHLRATKAGIDASYKTTVWNLSQNVDRQIGSGRLGISPCLTPTMIAYITNRGGPLVGVEALGLQGLPVDRLLLTRETQDQLADLAGNAMSTTVVGSAMVLALILATPVLEKALEESNDSLMDIDIETIVDRPLFTQTLDERISGMEHLETHPLKLDATGGLGWSELLRDAVKAKRWCRCEGRSSVSDNQMQECPDCGSTACVKCGIRPEHRYFPVTFDVPRPQPVKFAEEAKKFLPMALSFDNAPDEETFGSLRKNSPAGDVQFDLWKAWKVAVCQAMSDQLSFVDLRRQEIWVAVYENPFARLELHLHPQQAEWRLFAIPSASLNANDPVRGMLASPVARMICQGGLLSGKWEYAMPGRTTVKVAIYGVNEGEEALTDSWEKSLGLVVKALAEKMVWKRLRIEYKDGNHVNHPFDRDITGIYEYLPKCGTAGNSLHKRVKDSQGRDVDPTQPSLFFFLDPTRCREGSWDSFVFSTSMRRYEYEENRPIVAKLNPEWRQSDRPITEAKCSVDWTWVSAEILTCKPTLSESAVYSTPKGSLRVIVDNDTCARANALLTCSVHLGGAPSKLWPVDQWFEVDKLREREYLRLMSWILQRVRDVSHDAQWKEVVLAPGFEQHGYDCQRCASSPPKIMWYKREKGRGTDIRAIEEPQQAGPYERALKARPSPFQIHVKYSSEDRMGHIVIGVNPATLIHQAAANLPKRPGLIDAAWRLDTSYVPMPLISSPNFVIPSNRHDDPASQPKGFKLKLRPEQLRSLKWMQSQEDTVEPFMEEEICEGTSEHLGWRLEGRARRPIMVRGGVLADQVGYGKTAIMLGLISTRNGKRLAKDNSCPPGKLMAKGTVVIVPAHLVLQWEAEVEKFISTMGKEPPKVITLLQGSDINSTTIEDIQEADIIIVASSMPNSEHYWDNLGTFAGVSLPNKAGRYFNARLKQAHEGLSAQVQRLQRDGGVKAVHKVIVEASANAVSQEVFVQPKRLKGKAYAEANQDKGKELKDLSSHAEESDQAIAVPVKSKKSPVSSKKPEKQATEPRKKTIPGPSRVFSGVYPPSLEEVTKEAKARLAASNKSGRGARRKSSNRSVIDSDSEDDTSAQSAKDGDSGEGDYIGTSDGDESSSASSFKEELEPSSEDAAISISAEESDVARITKAKSVKKPTKAPKEAASQRGQKRKTMETDAEQSGGAEEHQPPQKKAKVVKPKKDRVAMDPWRLTKDSVQKDWTQMRAPPLDMFHFHRLVIDEFTYTKKEHVSHAIVTQLSANCRWVMSGTPPTGDFASVKGIASFLGIHLGIDDDAEGSTEEVKSRLQDKTAAEAFHSFRDVRSPYWHSARHDIAQRFLDKFVRQNLAEIDDIPLVERICAVTLTASERALYLELEHYLRAQELKMKKTGKSQSDRVRRLNKALGESKTPEEALLKSASHFDCQVDAARNSTVACDIIVEQRTAERDKCRRELRRKLIRAFKREAQLKKTRQETNVKSHFIQTLTEWDHGGDKDQETKEILAALVAEARQPDAEPDPESSSEEEETMNKKGKKAPSKAKAKQGKKSTTDGDEELKGADLEWAHREAAHELRALAKELGGRVRSLRFFQCVRSFQGDESLQSTCPRCGRSGLPPNEVSILSSCGHVGCFSCVSQCAASEACVQQSSGDCRVPASSLFVVPADSLGHDKSADSKGRHWGQKLEDIVALIKSYPKEERVLLFVQFPDLTKKVGEALTAQKLEYSEIRGTALQQSKVLQDFQNPKSKARILLLNLGDESASGGNLTVANHAIFISPLLAKNQFEYTQAETQAIGRIRRFGQVKTANIYRFVTRNTIDEDIYKGRGQALGDLSQKVQINQAIAVDKAKLNTTSSAVEADSNQMVIDDSD